MTWNRNRYPVRRGHDHSNPYPAYFHDPLGRHACCLPGYESFPDHRAYHRPKPAKAALQTVQIWPVEQISSIHHTRSVIATLRPWFNGKVPQEHYTEVPGAAHRQVNGGVLGPPGRCQLLPVDPIFWPGSTRNPGHRHRRFDFFHPARRWTLFARPRQKIPSSSEELHPIGIPLHQPARFLPGNAWPEYHAKRQTGR